MAEEEKKIKPKQYSHIDYEALLIYAMKNHISLEKAMEENELAIARSTVIRNIRRMKQEKGRDTRIIEFYQQVYVPNYQKSELPEKIVQAIEELPEKRVVIKNELEDLYNKLYIMNEIVKASDGNMAEATRKINSGQTRIRKGIDFKTRFRKRYYIFSKDKTNIRRKNKRGKRRRRNIIWQNIHQ